MCVCINMHIITPLDASLWVETLRHDYSLFWGGYIFHVIKFTPQKLSAEPRNSASAEALAVTRRPKRFLFCLAGFVSEVTWICTYLCHIQCYLAFTRYCFTAQLYCGSLSSCNPPPPCNAYPIAILLHYFCAIYTPQPTPPCACHTPYTIGDGNIV